MSNYVENFILGPIDNNTYLFVDDQVKQAVMIDPAAPSRDIIAYLTKHDLTLTQIWLTHAHFDHIGGVRWFTNQLENDIEVLIHPDALPLWENHGGALDFGFDFDPGPPPNSIVKDGDEISFGENQFTVFHTPGHTPGHVVYYCANQRIAFCGDLIFYHGVGRTDLKGSDQNALITSISEKILTLPDDTILYPGHGKPTTVKEEILHNPFI